MNRSIHRFAADRAGLAAIEFALIAPIVIFLFFAVVEGSNALTVSRRVSLAVNTLADLASQETQLSAAQASDLFEGVEQIIAQGPIVADIRLVSLVIDPDTDDVVVHWSRDNAGGAPYAPGSVYADLPDASLLDPSTSLIVGEIDYAYVSPLTKVLIPSVNFDKIATRWPRRSARVQFCIAPNNCTS
ncbi:MAG: TadE/TadG family type IV pilus assembly protein [Amphiplicatus sp.]